MKTSLHSMMALALLDLIVEEGKIHSTRWIGEAVDTRYIDSAAERRMEVFWILSWLQGDARRLAVSSPVDSIAVIYTVKRVLWFYMYALAGIWTVTGIWPQNMVVSGIENIESILFKQMSLTGQQSTTLLADCPTVCRNYLYGLTTQSRSVGQTLHPDHALPWRDAFQPLSDGRYPDVRRPFMRVETRKMRIVQHSDVILL